MKINNDTFTPGDGRIFGAMWGAAGHGGYGRLIHEGNWSGDNRTTRGFSPNQCCFRALSHIYVMYDGRISTCCFDPTGKQIFGDLNKESLREAYNRDPYLNFREEHANDRADRFPICASCTRI